MGSTGKASPKRLTLAAHVTFVPTGVVTVLLGPLLPTLSANWALNDKQAGYLFTAQFAGSMVGTAVSGVLVHRFGYRTALVGGLVMMAAGVVALPVSPWLLGLACVLCYGFGLGLAMPAANLLVAEENPENRGAALNLLNFSWSVGAVSCPFLVGSFSKSHHIALLMLLLAAVMIVLSIAIGSMRSAADTAGSAERKVEFSFRTVPWTNRYISILGLLFFLYVGTENAVGGWVASYAKRMVAQPGTFWVMTPSFFYGALLLGRGLASVALRRMEELRLARGGLLAASLGVAALLCSHTMTGVVASATVIGLGLAAVYPITIAMLSHKFGAGASGVGSLLFSLGNVGGASLPWLVGYASTRFDSLKVGLAVPLIAGVLMLSLYLGNWRLGPVEAPASAV
jgi:FHS family glucose/mannose:H+ symporter-like MFS transporter